MADDEPARYQLGPRSRRGLVAGWRAGQLAVVAGGLVVATGALRALGGAVGFVAAVAVAGAAVAAVTWPLAGRTPEQWAPVVVAHLLRRARAGAGGPAAAGTSRPRRPSAGRGALEALALDDVVVDERGRRVGVVVDRAHQTLTAALRVGATGYGLVGEAERARRVAAWSSVLASLAREASGVHRLQWIARTGPLDRRHGLDDQPVDGPEGARASYRSLLASALPQLYDHEVLIAVTVRTAGRRAGAEPGARLVEELASLERRLVAAGVEVDGALAPSSLADWLRRAVAAPSAPSGLADAWPWPLGVEAAWGTLRTDATWQAVYWIAEWPRSEVGNGFLAPVLLDGGLRRALAVTMAPVAPLRAVRRAEHERTSGVADAELRRRHGFAVSARTRLEHEVAVRREAELAAGHAAFRFTGYLAVTAADVDELELACRRVEQSAALAQLELHRLYGDQEQAWCCTLPTGRGCT